MADKKISELDTIASVSPTDLVAIVDTSGSVTNKATASSLSGANNFSSRSSLVSAWGALSATEKAATPVGTVWTWPKGSVFFMPAGHFAYGTDPISDLAGWYPLEVIQTPHHYGAVGDDTTDDTQAIRDLIAGAPSGGHIHFADADGGAFLVDGLVESGTSLTTSAFYIDKPLTVTGDQSGLIRVDGGSGSSFFDMGERGTLFMLDSSDILFRGVHMDLNSENIYGTEGDGTKYYAENAAGDATIGVTGIKLYRSDSTLHTSNVIVEDCQFLRVSFAAVSLSGRKLDTAAPDPVTYYNDNIFDTQGTISNCHIRGCYSEGGQRSTFVITGGARHCSVERNFVYNAHWAGIRLYLMCYACRVVDNYVLYDGSTVDPTKVQTDDLAIERPGNVLPRLIRFGHGGRLPGTVRYCSARGNHMVVVNTAALDASLTDATIPLGRMSFRMETGTVGNEIVGNFFIGAAKNLAYLSESTDTIFTGNHMYGEDYDSQYQVGLMFGGNQTGGDFSDNRIYYLTRGVSTETTETFTDCRFNENRFAGNGTDIRLEGAVNTSEFKGNRGKDASILVNLTVGGSDNIIEANHGVCTTTILSLTDVQDSLVKDNSGSGYDTCGVDLRGDCSGSSVTGSFLRTTSATAGVRVLNSSSTGVRIYNNDLLGSGTDEIVDNGTDTEIDNWSDITDADGDTEVVRLPGGLQIATRTVEFDTAAPTTAVSFDYPKGFSGAVYYSAANVEEAVAGTDIAARDDLHQTLTCETTTSAWRIRARSYSSGDVGTLTVKLFAIGKSNP